MRNFSVYIVDGLALKILLTTNQLEGVVAGGEVRVSDMAIYELAGEDGNKIIGVMEKRGMVEANTRVPKRLAQYSFCDLDPWEESVRLILKRCAELPDREALIVSTRRDYFSRMTMIAPGHVRLVII
jgi:hypothetical protein